MDNKLFIKIWKAELEKEFSNYTLLLPSISVGNVGQLAVDIIIGTLEATQVGILHHPALLPICGYNAYDSKSVSITTAADLYVYHPAKLLILQLRSHIIQCEKQSFLHELSEWISNCSFKSIIALGSCQARYRHDSELIGNQIRYFVNEFYSLEKESMSSLVAEPFVWNTSTSEAKEEADLGLGFIKDLINLCSLSAVVLVKFVDEGDNKDDALSLVLTLNKWKKIKSDDKWIFPTSWRNLFGPPTPPSLY